MSRPRLDSRRSMRAAVTLEVQYRTAGSFLVSYSQNLSKGGLFLETSERRPVGSTLVVRFTIPGVSEPIETHARVMWVRELDSPDGQRPGLGLAFDQLDTHIGTHIDELVRGFAGVTLMAAADETSIERVSRYLCNVLTCTVVRATSPRIAIALLSPEIDLVLLDLDSFGAEGIAVIEAAREHAPRIPLVAVARNPQWAEPAITAGAAAMLQHPPRHKDLCQTILDLLGKPASS